MALKKDLMADLNKAKYANAPTWDEIKGFLDEMNMKGAHFERYYGLKQLHLAKVKVGDRKLAAKYWHIIFERIKPLYGVGFAEEITINTQKNRIKTIIPKNIPVIPTTDTLHDRLGNIK